MFPRAFETFFLNGFLWLVIHSWAVATVSIPADKPATKQSSKDTVDISQNDLLQHKNTSAYIFLKNIYVDDQHRPYRSGKFYLADHDIQPTESSDTIISYLVKKTYRGGAAVLHQVGGIEFDGFNKLYNGMAASFQLKVYKESRSMTNLNEPQNVLIDLYVKVLDEGGSSYRFIESKNVSADYRGWLTFNITDSIDNSTESHYVIASKDFNDKLSHDLSMIHLDGGEETQPFVVGYYNHPDSNMLINKIDFLRRQKRDLGVEAVIDKQMKSMSKMVKPYSNAEFCSIQPYSIDLTEWSDEVIIAPKSINIQYCAGECGVSDIFSRVNTNMHTAWQALLSLQTKSRMPAPCCVATAFKSFTMIRHLDADNGFAFGSIPGAVASECGCR